MRFKTRRTRRTKGGWGQGQGRDMAIEMRQSKENRDATAARIMAEREIASARSALIRAERKVAEKKKISNREKERNAAEHQSRLIAAEYAATSAQAKLNKATKAAAFKAAFEKHSRANPNIGGNYRNKTMRRFNASLGLTNRAVRANFGSIRPRPIMGPNGTERYMSVSDRAP